MGASSGGDAGAIPLTDLILSSYEIPERFLPDWLLGGSAPRLRLLQLNFISLPVLLLSATHLVHPRLHGISSWVYITQGDGHLPFHIGQPRITFPWILVLRLSC